MAKIKDFFVSKKVGWLIADFLFIFDLCANIIVDNVYYEIFKYCGVDGYMVNSIISILEVVRMITLLHEKHRY